MTHEPPTPDDELIDRFWDYLHGELDAEAAHDLEKQLLADKHAAETCRDLVEVMVMAQDAFKREGAALHELSQLTGPQLLAELARRESLAQATLVDLSEPTVLHLKGQTPHEKISLAQFKAAGSYLFMHGIKSKAAMIGGIAAAILLAALLAVNFIGQPVQEIAEQPAQHDPAQSQGQIVATLAAEQNARWAEPNITPGQPLRAGQRLTLIRGQAEIRTNAGAIAVLEAPVSVELIDHDNALRLSAGKLVGICETQASKGLLVRTPHADVIDLGTRFGVEVIPGRASEVHVHQGEVVVTARKADGGSKPTRTSVVANEAVRIDALSNQWVEIEPAFNTFSEALSVHRLFSTGFDLPEGSLDSRWQIVADGKGPLDQPIALRVQYGERPGNHFPAKGNDPTKAQWLTFAPGYALYGDPNRPDLDRSTLTIQTHFDLPDSVRLDNAAFALKYASGYGLTELRINGTRVETVPAETNATRRETTYREIELAAHTTSLRSGENIIEIDFPEPARKTQAPPTIYFDAELRPASAPSHPSIGENQP